MSMNVDLSCEQEQLNSKIITIHCEHCCSVGKLEQLNDQKIL